MGVVTQGKRFIRTFVITQIGEQVGRGRRFLEVRENRKGDQREKKELTLTAKGTGIGSLIDGIPGKRVRKSWQPPNCNTMGRLETTLGYGY